MPHDDLTQMIMDQYGLSSDDAKVITQKIVPVAENGVVRGKEAGVAKPEELASTIARTGSRPGDFNGQELSQIIETLGLIPRKAAKQAQNDKKNADEARILDNRFKGLPPNTLPGGLTPGVDYYPEGAVMGAKGYIAPEDMSDAVEPDYPTGQESAELTPAMAIKYPPPMSDTRQRDLATERNRGFAAEDNARYAAQAGPIKSVDIGPITQRYNSLDVGPIEVSPTKPQSNLEYLKQLHDAHNERINAYKMLKEYVHAQDAIKANEAQKGILWSMLTPQMAVK